ncbi:MAG: dihydrofolate reductase [Flavobacteriales bacterium]|nr:dihydrofolate reductase [Flavobacteriales bacterium]
MIKKTTPFFALLLIFTLSACKETKQKEIEETSLLERKIPNERQVDRFADIQILRYEIKGFDLLSLSQKQLVYFLSQAGLSGRDIIYDQNNAYNLEIRRCLEGIIKAYKGDKESDQWYLFMTYAKQVWFANGIHHHYGMEKFTPKFSQEYFATLLESTNVSISLDAVATIFNKDVDRKRKVKDPNVDMIIASANNFYGEGVTLSMVEDFYKIKIDTLDPYPIEYGLNSTMVLVNDSLKEDVWKSGGKYGKAIDKIIYNLEMASNFAENQDQKAAIDKLIEYYKTGDLRTWDEYSILWAKSTQGDIDWINGFIETYGDAIGKRASYESMVQITDFEASKQMQVVTQNAQWFEDNSPLIESHKKKNVKGVSYKVVQVASESGDASPSTPIGVNLPNNNWIRQDHGSKSVSLGNIIAAYDKASGPGMLEEFAHDSLEISLANKHGYLAGKLHTALHEVVGHASGQINPGIGQPAETLKNYASTLEEARADLVGLYYLMDTKLIELGLITTLDVGKASYDNYIRNGMLTQLIRIDLGKKIEEEHMQNRQLVASWAIEKGEAENVIEKNLRDGKVFYNINNYEKLRAIFGELLREIQRIKSEGDYQAGMKLVENYGVNVDLNTHTQVLERTQPLDKAPYGGFVNPVFVPLINDQGDIMDIKIENNQNFEQQMMYYAEQYSTLE